MAYEDKQKYAVSLFLQQDTWCLNITLPFTVQWKMQALMRSQCFIWSFVWWTIPWVLVARMNFIWIMYYLIKQSLCFLRSFFLALTLRTKKTPFCHRFVYKLLKHILLEIYSLSHKNSHDLKQVKHNCWRYLCNANAIRLVLPIV